MPFGLWFLFCILLNGFGLISKYRTVISLNLQASIQYRQQEKSFGTAAMKEKDDDLALFLNMSKNIEDDRENHFLLQNSDGFDDSLGTEFCSYILICDFWIWIQCWLNFWSREMRNTQKTAQKVIPQIHWTLKSDVISDGSQTNISMQSNFLCVYHRSNTLFLFGLFEFELDVWIYILVQDQNLTYLPYRRWHQQWLLTSLLLMVYWILTTNLIMTGTCERLSS